MMIETSRRKFITGLSALIVAPAIVRVESLMPVRSIDLANYRYLIDYIIGTNTMVLRMDKALFKLPIPNYVRILTEAEVKKIAPDMLKTFKNVEVIEGVQKLAPVASAVIAVFRLPVPKLVSLNIAALSG